MAYELIPFPNDNALAVGVATRWLDRIAQAARSGEPHRAALAGGRITKGFLISTATEAVRRKLSLTGVEFFWGDERCVPPDDSDSNYKLAHECLFVPAGVSTTRCHRIRGEVDPVIAAREAAVELRNATATGPDREPMLDLVFLGMGEDGHVASLFPGLGAEITESASTYVAVTGPKPPPRRVSLTFGAIRAAREVWVLVSGSDKGTALKESLAGTRTPLGRVLSERAKTLVFTDVQAT